ncbi:MAG: hypothetical protein NTU84_00630 [Verrucomicrobia bacterium]|nr:hypothetical protein [Verrucomicrobiota bacterium]
MDLPLILEALKTGGPSAAFALVLVYLGKQAIAAVMAEFRAACTRIEERLERIGKRQDNDSLLHLADILGKQMDQTEIAGKIVELVQNNISKGQ